MTSITLRRRLDELEKAQRGKIVEERDEKSVPYRKRERNGERDQVR